MKSKDIRKLSEQDHDKKVSELKSELMKLKAQSATGTPPKNPGQIRQIRRLLARMQTIKKESESNKSEEEK